MFQNKRSQNWNRNKAKHRSLPYGIKGREIGLYYKNLNRNKEKKQRTMTLTIPHQVISSVKTNVQEIIELAKENNIQLPEIVTRPFTRKGNDDEVLQTTDNATTSSSENNKCDITCKSDLEDSLLNQPSTSSQGFSAEVENEIRFNNYDRQLSLNSSRSFRYGYQDMIKGTFDEKLEQCLSKDKSSDHGNKLLSKTYKEEYEEMLTRKGYQNLLKFREILPAYKKSNDVLNLINQNQVIVISGETGCGKSTQIPQIILDDALKNNRGANVKILVTQPRRIAASSLAARVAQERGEEMGNTVGYTVRLDKMGERRRGSIQYCTTGVLLVEMEKNQSLHKWTHVILDEVHERDFHVDMSMCMLKKILKKRKDMKLILMSATLDAANLSQYYDNCPVMHIEGLAYPVKDVYLEDILKEIEFKFPEFEPRQRKRPGWKKHIRTCRDADEKAMERDIRYKAEISKFLEPNRHLLDPDVYKTLQNPDCEELNLHLVLLVLKHICYICDPGSVLVFLPGISEISSMLKRIKDSNAFPSNLFEVYPLHSKLPSLDQHRIFEKPPKGIRKIILATNIAETSITIDDIVYVIDCGKIKTSGFNVEQKIQTLEVEWVSQANLRQRRGRAGRCQPGVCYHLMTSYRASKLAERLVPEVQRSNLLEPVLSVKRLRLGLAEDAFKDMPSPPDPSTVKWAVKHLQQCGALDEREQLTPLGWHLARLPVHPAAGKLLLLSALFGCLDRGASVAAVWGFKDPFQLVIGKEKQIDESRRYLALDEPSDHIAVSEAIMGWEQCQSARAKEWFAFEHFLSSSTLELLVDMKKQLGASLMHMGFLESGDLKSKFENRNSLNLSLFKALVAASLYPNVASVRWKNLNNPKKATFFVYTPEEGRTRLHPSSVMFVTKEYAKGPTRPPLCKNPGANWLVYWLKQRSVELYLFDVTLIFTLPLLFFGEFIFSNVANIRPNECTLSIKSINVICKKEDADVICKLRSLLDLVLAAKVTSTNNTTKHNAFENEVIKAVIKIITAEDEQVDYVEDDFMEFDTSDGEPSRKH